MEIGQLFEATISLRFACEKFQNGVSGDETASSKEDLRARVLQILERISSFCELQQTDSLEELFNLFEGIFEKYKLESVFDGQLEFVILFESQKAHLYQTLSKFEKLNDSLAKLEALYLKILNVSPEDLSVDFLSVSNLHFPGSRQIFGNRVLNLVKLALGLCQVYLQRTAVFSQMNKHSEALAFAEKVSVLAYRIIDRIVDIFGYFRSFGVTSSETLDAFKGQINDFAIFFDYLKRTRETLKEINEQPKSGELLWRMSSDATLKQLLQRIHTQKEPGTSLGLPRKLPCEDLNTFHISSLVKLPAFAEAVRNLDQAKFEERLLNRATLILASAIFSIATENRFISFLEIQEQMQSVQADQTAEKKVVCETVSKEYKLQINKRFILSERIHLLAIDMVTFGYSDTSKLAVHFFQSYKKNYSVDIFVIEEEDEQSFSTIKTAPFRDSVTAGLVENSTPSQVKNIKISLNKYNLEDFKKRPKPEAVVTENGDLSSQHSPPGSVPASQQLLTIHSPAPVVSSTGNIGGTFKDFYKQKPKAKDAETSIRHKALQSNNGYNRELEVNSVQLTSIDRFKIGWSGLETQKKANFAKQPEQAASKRNKADVYANMLQRQKNDFLNLFKVPKKEPVDTSIASKTLDTIAKASEKTIERKESLKPQDKKLSNEILEKPRTKSRRKNSSSSSDFLRSVQNIPSLAPENSRTSLKKNQRKNVDRLGTMSSKFANLINESQRDFRAKYEEKIKEKVAGQSGHFQK